MAIYENFPYKESLATNDRDGLMSKSDKVKLDNINIGTVETIYYILSANQFDSGEMILPIEIEGAPKIITGLNNKILTKEEYNAAAMAKFIVKQTDGGLKFTCIGTPPSIDIPIYITIIKEP